MKDYNREFLLKTTWILLDFVVIMLICLCLWAIQAQVDDLAKELAEEIEAIRAVVGEEKL